VAKYDRQLLILFHDGGGDADLKESGRDLLAKIREHPLESAFVEVPPLLSLAVCEDGTPDGPDAPWFVALRTELGKLTRQSRLYLQGKGDWRRQTVGDWGGKAAADLLAGAGLSAVKVISIIAGEAGRDREETTESRTAEPPDSFASWFHRRLKEGHGIEVDVLARVFKVAVLPEASGSNRGRKVTYEGDGASALRHRPESKLRFTWADGRQVRSWVEYASQKEPSGEDPLS
jgi:hypothetical protein